MANVGQAYLNRARATVEKNHPNDPAFVERHLQAVVAANPGTRDANADPAFADTETRAERDIRVSTVHAAPSAEFESLDDGQLLFNYTQGVVTFSEIQNELARRGYDARSMNRFVSGGIAPLDGSSPVKGTQIYEDLLGGLPSLFGDGQSPFIRQQPEPISGTTVQPKETIDSTLEDKMDAYQRALLEGTNDVDTGLTGDADLTSNVRYNMPGTDWATSVGGSPQDATEGSADAPTTNQRFRVGDLTANDPIFGADTSGRITGIEWSEGHGRWLYTIETPTGPMVLPENYIQLAGDRYSGVTWPSDADKTTVDAFLPWEGYAGDQDEPLANEAAQSYGYIPRQGLGGEQNFNLGGNYTLQNQAQLDDALSQLGLFGDGASNNADRDRLLGGGGNMANGVNFGDYGGTRALALEGDSPFTRYLRRRGVGTTGGLPMGSVAGRFQESRFQPLESLYNLTGLVNTAGGFTTPSTIDQFTPDFQNQSGYGWGGGHARRQAGQGVLSRFFGLSPSQRGPELGFDPSYDEEGGLIPGGHGMGVLQNLIGTGARQSRGAVGASFLANRVPRILQEYQLERPTGTNFVDYLRSRLGLGDI